MEFGDFNWQDIESYLKQDDRVVLITGACEQHDSLSLMTDIRAPMAIAQAACQQEKVLIAPPLNFGISPYFTAYPGTISLKPEVFVMVVRNVLEELIRQGFRKILLSNGHGGNSEVLRALLSENASSYQDVTCRLFEWWKHPVVDAIAQEAGLQPGHANWLENFPFTRVGDVPDGSKDFVDLPSAGSADEMRAVLGGGSFGGAYQAPDTVMESLFAALVEAMAVELRGLRS